MGTPLPPKYIKSDGSHYLSGTEWEYEDAMRSYHTTGRPVVVVYRRTEKIFLDPDDAKFADKLEQRQRVNAFFAAFVNPDGSIRQGYNMYKTMTEFRTELETHLKQLIKQFLQQQSLKSEIERLLEEYRQANIPEYRRQTIIDRLAEIGEEAIPDLLTILKTKIELDTALSLCKALSKFPSTIHPLIEILNDVSNINRAYAATALGLLHSSEAIPYLIEALKDESSFVRDRVVTALGKMGDIKVNSELTKLYLVETDHHVQARIVSVLGNSKDPNVLGTVIKALRNKQYMVQQFAIRALANFIDPQSVTALKKYYKKAKYVNAYLCALSLGKLGDDEGVSLLIKALASPYYRDDAAEIVEVLSKFDTVEVRDAVSKWRNSNK